MLGDLPGMIQLIAMVGSPCLGLNEPLESLSQRDLLLLAEDDPFMCLGSDLGGDPLGRPLVRRAGGADDGLMLDLELNVLVLRVCPPDQCHPSTKRYSDTSRENFLRQLYQ